MNNPMNPGWGQGMGYSQQYPNNQIMVDRQDPRTQQYNDPRYNQSAYGSGTQMNYQPNYIMQAPSYQPGQYGRGHNNQTLVRVLSRAEAEGYYVAPGNTVAMITNDNKWLFVKAVSLDGIPTFEGYALIPEHNMSVPPPEPMPGISVGGQNPTAFVRREEYNQLKDELDRVVEAMTRLTERMRDDGRESE